MIVIIVMDRKSSPLLRLPIRTFVSAALRSRGSFLGVPAMRVTEPRDFARVGLNPRCNTIYKTLNRLTI
jgi:hypothetical protein